jgi:hypothetical protein
MATDEHCDLKKMRQERLVAQQLMIGEICGRHERHFFFSLEEKEHEFVSSSIIRPLIRVV